MTPLLQLYRWMRPGRRRQLFLLFALMIAGSLAELLTIGTALVFLGFVVGSGPAPGPLADLFEAAPIGVAAEGVAAAALAGSALRLALTWQSQKLAWGLGHEIATEIFARALRQPYAAYLERHSSDTLGGMEKVRIVVIMLLSPVMQGLSAVTIAVFVTAALLMIAPAPTLIGGATAAVAYACISLAGNRRLQRNARLIASTTSERSRVLQEGLGAIRDILLDRSQAFFEERYRRLDESNRRAQAENAFISAAPRFVIEGVGIAMIALVAGYLSRESGAALIPVLGALAIGMQRLLPLLQQAYWASTSAWGNMPVLSDIMALLEAPVVEEVSPGSGRERRGDITLDDVGFSYGPGQGGLRGVTLAIRSGERVGLTGPSGSGKSTLMDVLMGLLQPDAGSIRVGGETLTPADHRLWQRRIGHVPQDVYLVDDSIAANVCLGLEPSAIDLDRVRDLLALVELDDLVARLPEGLETRVGERGVRLSGGQKQRIGIARALYKTPDLLILDEATNALDEAAESRVLARVAALPGDMTILVVAHRASAFALCDRVLSMEELSDPSAPGA